MLLTIATTHAPATDLGYLLQHPDRCQSFDLAFGKAHVFYPTAGDDCCTAALLLDVDPVGMVRNRRGPAGEGFHLRQYVNDRPFVASSLMSVAIARVFGSGLSGRCEQRSELVGQPPEGTDVPPGEARLISSSSLGTPLSVLIVVLAARESASVPDRIEHRLHCPWS